MKFKDPSIYCIKCKITLIGLLHIMTERRIEKTTGILISILKKSKISRYNLNNSYNETKKYMVKIVSK